MTENDVKQLNKLIISVAEGDADALDGIYALAGKKMFAVAVSTAGRFAAEDVVHDSLIKIARFAHKYKRNNPYGWLMKIVRNTALDYIKANRPNASTEEFYNLTSSDYSPENTENAVMLEQALNKLGKDERQVIYFRYFLDMTVREIAAETRMSKSAVQRLIERAEEKLKNLLKTGQNGF